MGNEAEDQADNRQASKEKKNEAHDSPWTDIACIEGSTCYHFSQDDQSLRMKSETS
jgi:hypothetical protein